MKTKIYNTLLAIAIASGMVFSFYYLERAFRGGDTRRAVQAVQQLRPKGQSQTVLETLQEKYKTQTGLMWYAEIEDSMRGLIRVYCKTPDNEILSWQVNVLRGAVSKISPRPKT